jgi:hypothetical protein
VTSSSIPYVSFIEGDPMPFQKQSNFVFERHCSRKAMALYSWWRRLNESGYMAGKFRSSRRSTPSHF